MAYIDGVYARMDEVISDPTESYSDIRERLQEFVAHELRNSFWNGVHVGADRKKAGFGGDRSAMQAGVLGR
jgi:hypothetical protein